MKTFFYKNIQIVLLALVLTLSISNAFAWSGPTAPPPGGNVLPPVNTSDVTQLIPGQLTVGGFRSIAMPFYASPYRASWFSSSTRASWPPTTLTLAINGNTGASRYCDDNAQNCKTILDMAIDGPAGLAGLPGETTVPSGAVVPFSTSVCPSGWTRFSPADGRYVVGLNNGGRLGLQIGDNLSEGENRPTGAHTHTYTYWRITASYTGEKTSKIAGSQMAVDSTPKTDNATGRAGTNAPYVQMLYCEKN